MHQVSLQGPRCSVTAQHTRSPSIGLKCLPLASRPPHMQCAPPFVEAAAAGGLGWAAACAYAVYPSDGASYGNRLIAEHPCMDPCHSCQAVVTAHPCTIPGYHTKWPGATLPEPTPAHQGCKGVLQDLPSS
jgi:hypothetical protein